MQLSDTLQCTHALVTTNEALQCFPIAWKKRSKVRLVSTLFQEKALNQYIPRNASVSACSALYTRSKCLSLLCIGFSSHCLSKSFFFFACWVRVRMTLSDELLNKTTQIKLGSKHMWNITEWDMKLNVPLGWPLRLSHFANSEVRAKKCIIISTYIYSCAGSNSRLHHNWEINTHTYS